MLAEWTAECAHDDPIIEVPWSDPATGLHFIDLRANPYDVAEIHEADRYPALQRALRSLNATRSPVLTSKCDTWQLSAHQHADELSTLRLELDLDPEAATHGFSSYIDFLYRERSIFTSAHHQQQRLDSLTRRAERLHHPEAALAFVLRPALYAGSTLPIEGFAVTLYLRAAAHDATAATTIWCAALEDITALLRDPALNPAQASATIDAALR